MIAIINDKITLKDIVITDDYIYGILVRGPWIEHPCMRNVQLYSNQNASLGALFMRLGFIESSIIDNSLKVGILK